MDTTHNTENTKIILYINSYSQLQYNDTIPAPGGPSPSPILESKLFFSNVECGSLSGSARQLARGAENAGQLTTSLIIFLDMPKAYYIDLLSPDVFRSFSAKPERLKDICVALSAEGIVIIDEMQKVPELLDVVHQQLL